MRRDQARPATARPNRAPLAVVGLAIVVLVALIYVVASILPSPTPSPTPSMSSPSASQSAAPSIGPTPSGPSDSPTPTPTEPATSPTPSTSPGAAVAATSGTQTYDFKSTLNFRSGRLDTDQTLTWTNTGTTPVDYIDLSVLPRVLDMLTMGDITVDGRPTTTEWTTNTNLRVDFPQPLAVNQTATIQIGFTLNIDGSKGEFRSRLAKRGGLIYAGGWFPIWSREHDSYGIGDPQVSYNAESYRFDLTTTGNVGRNAVVATGQRLEASDNHWLFEAHNVRDFAFVVSPNSSRATGSVSCSQGSKTITTQVIVVTYIAPARTVLSNVISAVRRLNGLYGCYPWPTLSVAEVDYGEGMEYPQLIYIGKDWITSSRYITNHEVAHQWWYAQVGNDQQLEPWIDEAWAQFSASYLSSVPFYSCSRQPVNQDVFQWPGNLRSGNWYGPQSYVETVYWRGAQFLDELRRRMGTSDFFAAARKIVSKYRYRIITTDEMIQVFKDSTSANIQPIIDRYFSVGPRVPGSYGGGRGIANHCSGAPRGY